MIILKYKRKSSKKEEMYMIEDKIKTKRKQLNESLEKDGKYEDIYRLSVELDELITEFYKDSKEKRRMKTIKRQNKILYIA